MSGLKDPKYYFSGENGVYYNIVKDTIFEIGGKEKYSLIDISTLETSDYYKYRVNGLNGESGGKYLLSIDFSDESKCIYLGEL